MPLQKHKFTMDTIGNLSCLQAKGSDAGSCFAETFRSFSKWLSVIFRFRTSFDRIDFIFFGHFKQNSISDQKKHLPSTSLQWYHLSRVSLLWYIKTTKCRPATPNGSNKQQKNIKKQPLLLSGKTKETVPTNRNIIQLPTVTTQRIVWEKRRKMQQVPLFFNQGLLHVGLLVLGQFGQGLLKDILRRPWFGCDEQTWHKHIISMLFAFSSNQQVL